VEGAGREEGEAGVKISSRHFFLPHSFSLGQLLLLAGLAGWLGCLLCYIWDLWTGVQVRGVRKQTSGVEQSAIFGFLGGLGLGVLVLGFRFSNSKISRFGKWGVIGCGVGGYRWEI